MTRPIQFIGFSILLVGVGALGAWSLAGTSAPERPVPEARSAARGKYIVEAFACHDCHTPHRLGPNGPELDTERLLSGHPAFLELPAPPQLPEGPWVAVLAGTMTAWSGPWGISYTANLTPDEETGLGTWTEEEFIATLKTGRHRGRGREILPPMPIEATRNLSEDDLASVFAYLRTIPKISNRVPTPVPPPTGQ